MKMDWSSDYNFFMMEYQCILVKHFYSLPVIAVSSFLHMKLLSSVQLINDNLGERLGRTSRHLSLLPDALTHCLGHLCTGRPLYHTYRNWPPSYRTPSHDSLKTIHGTVGTGRLKRPRIHRTATVVNKYVQRSRYICINNTNSKVHGAYMRPTWGRQDPGGPHVGPMILAIWECMWHMMLGGYFCKRKLYSTGLINVWCII